jgi:hypothetical protein
MICEPVTLRYCVEDLDLRHEDTHRPAAVAQLLNLPPKTPADGAFESTQVAGHVPGQVGSGAGLHAATSTDLNVLRHLARNYRAFCNEGLTVDQICKHNAKVCESARTAFQVLKSNRLR